MKYTISYPGLTESLKHFKIAVLESIPYCANFLPPHIKTPEDIFYYLKQHTTYKLDPKGEELFQKAQTLMENNYHGIPGAGDCDCFSILILASLIAKNYKNCGIVLVGRNPKQAVHIYCYVDYNGKREYLDLTNKIFNFERDYPFKQEIKFINSPIKIIFK